MTKTIHFIVNPIAGYGKHLINEKMLRTFFHESWYVLVVKNTQYKKQAVELTMASIQEGADIIVACGGDGTINEVASCLVGTSVTLGIIPVGSGNGLASNLQIPRALEKSILRIRQNNKVKMDVGRINDRYFFSNTGFGFDANVIKHYEASERRTILAYIGASLKSFREVAKGNDRGVIIDNTEINDPFLIFISNSNQLGYRMSLTPKASLFDGKLDVMIVPRISRLKMLLFGALLLMRMPNLLREVKSFQTTSIRINGCDKKILESQIDGELIQLQQSNINISVLSGALHVIA